MTLKELIEALQSAVSGGISEDYEVIRIANMPEPTEVTVTDVGSSSVHVMPSRS